MKMLMLLLLVSGCAHHRQQSNNGPRPFHIVHVDAISEGASPKRFKVVSGMSELKDTDLRFKQLARIATKALMVDGYIEDVKAPEIIISLVFSVGNPETTVTKTTTPVFGMKSSDVSNSFGQHVGSIDSFGQTGTRTSSSSRTLYVLKAGLKAVSAKTKNEVWGVDISSVGLTNDLVEVFPYMMFGATGHYGTTSKERYNVNKGDARVLALTSSP